MRYPPYRDRHGNLIEKGDVLRCIVPGLHDKDEIIYSNIDDDDLGMNASNERYIGFDPSLRQIYSLMQFDLSEWEIVKKASDEHTWDSFERSTCIKEYSKKYEYEISTCYRDQINTFRKVNNRVEYLQKFKYSKDGFEKALMFIRDKMAEDNDEIF